MSPRRRPFARPVLLLAAILALGGAAACSGTTGSPGPTTIPTTPASGSPSANASGPPRSATRGDPDLLYDGSPIFGPTTFWHQRVTDAPVAADSAEVVADLVRQVGQENAGVASFNVWKYNAAIVTVGADQKRVDIGFDNCQHKKYTPKGLTGPGGQFTDVPLPTDIATNGGTDSSLALYSPQTHELWEFWKLKHSDAGWTACWGGHIPDTRISAGYFEGGFGTTATGLAGVEGAVHLADVQSGHIDHALTIAVRSAASWKQVSWPAQRSDGSPGSKDPIQEGQRFRLPPSVDVDALPLSPIGKLVAHAAQDYGLIVSDRAGTVSIGGESGAEAKAVTGTNPWYAILAGEKSYQVLHDFPWSQLQALPVDWGEPANAG